MAMRALSPEGSARKAARGHEECALPPVDRPADGERGAAAVEFALVSLLLFPLIFGIIDFGLWFSDSVNTRQGVREAARSGVVQTADCSEPSATGLQEIACVAVQQTAPTAGSAWARVVVPEAWEKRKPLLVCAMVQETGVTGITPLPNDGIIRSKTFMSIEVDSSVPAGADTAGASAVWPASPAPADWAWCS
jgi:Flp pilus assembly protein TadG